MKRLFIGMLLAVCGAAAAGGIAVVQFDDAAQAVRYKTLIKELRCLVCQNQTLNESDADLARDMRSVVADLVRRDAPDREIIGFMTARYGDFVRYRPPLRGRTVVLWLAPFVLAALLLLLLPRLIGGRRPAVLSDEQKQRAARLLEE